MSFSLQKHLDFEKTKYVEKNNNSLAEIKFSKQFTDPSNVYIIGLIAGTLSSIAFIPQVIQAFKNKEASRITIITLILAIIGQLLWITYGITSNDKIIRTFASITVFLYILLAISKFIFNYKMTTCPQCDDYPLINF